MTLRPEVAVAVATLAFLMFDLVGRPERLVRVVGIAGAPRPVHPVVLRRLLGFFVLGVLPAIAVAITAPEILPRLGLKAQRALTAAQLLSLLLLITLALALLCRIPSIRRSYPAIEQETWTPSTVAANAVSWTLYLLAYEFCFRGLLLFPLAGAFGPAAAVSITTALYAFAHLRSGAAEAAGSVLAGPLFAGLALYTGAVWVPFAAHLVLALSADTFSLLYREDRHLILGRPAAHQG
jgi:membrane protease YdiL (CAAX protease family)